MQCTTCKLPSTKHSEVETTTFAPQLLVVERVARYYNNEHKETWVDEVRVDNAIEFNGCSYSLRGFVIHHKRTELGDHYTAYCKTSSGWYHFNDSEVKKVNKIPRARPRLMVYEKEVS